MFLLVPITTLTTMFVADPVYGLMIVDTYITTWYMVDMETFLLDLMYMDYR